MPHLTGPPAEQTDVNGDEQHPVFQWLKEHTLVLEGFKVAADTTVSWNFNKVRGDVVGGGVRLWGCPRRAWIGGLGMRWLLIVLRPQPRQQCGRGTHRMTVPAAR